MSLSAILDSAVSGLAASQAGLRSAAANIAAAGTPGHAREEIGYAARVTEGRINGVATSEAQRVADRFLSESAAREAGQAEQAASRADFLGRLQAGLGAPGDPASLAGRIDAIAAKAIALTANPASPSHQQALASALDSAFGGLAAMRHSAGQLISEAASRAETTAARITTLLERIDTGNQQVAQGLKLSRSVVGPESDRRAAIDELASLVGITERPQPDGRIRLESRSGATLLDHNPRKLALQADGSVALLLPDGSQSPERLDGDAAGGRLGALLALGTGELPQWRDAIGGLADDLAGRINAVAAPASWLARDSAGNWRLAMPANALRVDNARALALAAAFEGGNPAEALISDLALASSAASDGAAAADARLTAATRRRDDFQGVNLDEELALTVTLQASYAASARIMTTVSEMMDELIAMVRR